MNHSRNKQIVKLAKIFPELRSTSEKDVYLMNLNPNITLKIGIPKNFPAEAPKVAVV